MNCSGSKNGCIAHHENRIEDRIVSICQPHIRPIKRGKANASTEFGAKILASLVDGWCFLDHLDWNNYNESGDLINQVEAYKDRFGFYPESLHADKIYRNQANIKFCKKHGTRLSGQRLGLPPKDLSMQAELKKQVWQDEIERIPTEGKFGQAKRRFGLARIMCKLARTSETAIAITFLVMNLEKWLKVFIFVFSNWRKSLFGSVYGKTKARLVIKNEWQMQIIEPWC